MFARRRTLARCPSLSRGKAWRKACSHATSGKLRESADNPNTRRIYAFGRGRPNRDSSEPLIRTDFAFDSLRDYPPFLSCVRLSQPARLASGALPSRFRLPACRGSPGPLYTRVGGGLSPQRTLPCDGSLDGSCSPASRLPHWLR